MSWYLGSDDSRLRATTASTAADRQRMPGGGLKLAAGRPTVLPERSSSSQRPPSVIRVFSASPGDSAPMAAARIGQAPAVMRADRAESVNGAIVSADLQVQRYAAERKGSRFPGSSGVSPASKPSFLRMFVHGLDGVGVGNPPSRIRRNDGFVASLPFSHQFNTLAGA